MKEIKYKIYDKKDITDRIANLFVSVLKQQKKVYSPTKSKIKNCRQIILCYIEDDLVGIGAIKPNINVNSIFTKADLANLKEKFGWELGYFYTNPNYRKFGIASTMTKLLLHGKENENFFATTEIYSTNSMIYILEKNGFRQCGKVWESTIHNGIIGLFIKVNEGQIVKTKTNENTI